MITKQTSKRSTTSDTSRIGFELNEKLAILLRIDFAESTLPLLGICQT
ncbi:hypothetical protein [Scopulibacillus daqui]|nr:hypothetical protein [Scopulibacillus daqui]